MLGLADEVLALDFDLTAAMLYYRERAAQLEELEREV